MMEKSCSYSVNCIGVFHGTWKLFYGYFVVEGNEFHGPRGVEISLKDFEDTEPLVQKLLPKANRIFKQKAFENNEKTKPLFKKHYLIYQITQTVLD